MKKSSQDGDDFCTGTEPSVRPQDVRMIKAVESFCKVQGNEATTSSGVLQVLQHSRPQMSKEVFGATAPLATILVPSHIGRDLTPRPLQYKRFQDLGEEVGARDVSASPQILQVGALRNHRDVFVPPE